MRGIIYDPLPSTPQSCEGQGEITTTMEVKMYTIDNIPQTREAYLKELEGRCAQVRLGMREYNITEMGGLRAIAESALDLPQGEDINQGGTIDLLAEVERLTAKCERHSKAPWWLNPELQTDEDSGIRYYEILDADGHEVHNQTGFQYDGDAKVATAAPDLLAEVTRLTAERDSLRGALETIIKWCTDEDEDADTLRILFTLDSSIANDITIEARAALEGGDTNGK